LATRQQPDGQEDQRKGGVKQNGVRATGSHVKRKPEQALMEGIFLPKDDTELEEWEDTFEKELNEFKRSLSML